MEKQGLRSVFMALAGTYCTNGVLVNKAWAEVEAAYSARKRHYHTLEHLEALLAHLNEARSCIQHRDAVLFALFYHDMVYSTLKQDNEEKSALLAQQRLLEMKVDITTVELCKAHILATKSHAPSSCMDTNYFTDADLSVLGMDWNTYSKYFKNVRKEYALYPDRVYKPGRTRVLKHFLEMDRIFKTDFFYTRLETQARLNIRKELEILEG